MLGTQLAPSIFDDSGAITHHFLNWIELTMFQDQFRTKHMKNTHVVWGDLPGALWESLGGLPEGM
jgi:hypothetical protein